MLSINPLIVTEALPDDNTNVLTLWMKTWGRGKATELAKLTYLVSAGRLVSAVSSPSLCPLCI